LVLSTRYLFRRLLRTLEIETVCDVGSMDGSDALLFRRMLPRARILALEANPRNLAHMEADENLRRSSIRIFPFAASDNDSQAPFFVARADYRKGHDRFRRGMSSLHNRADDSRLLEVVQVRTVRLDNLLAAESLVDRPVALWIDTEGMAFEVICGARRSLRFVRMLHVEVEIEPIIGANQKLFPDVERVLAEAGFAVLATDQAPESLQFNVLFVRTELLCANAGEIRSWATVARARHLVADAVSMLVPQRIARMLGMGWLLGRQQITRAKRVR
jgi:FkbM family methyltransferase